MPTEPETTQKKAVQHGPSRARSGDELRENFFSLLLRSYRIAEKQGKGLAVYHSCADMVYRLCGERWAQHTIFPEESALVRRFLGEAGLARADADAALQLNLMANPWAFTWTQVLQELDAPRFASVCSASGEDLLRSALAQGRGVVCAHYHTLFAPLFWTWLEHHGIAPGVLIREWVKSRPPAEAGDPKTQALEGARELKSSLDTLRRGGIAHVMADGYAGNRKAVLPFCNRKRGFETTFSDLALMSGAPILTVVARFGADGRVRIEIGPALSNDPALDRVARTERLLQQFLAHLHRHWLEHPADISWFQMKRHLALPPA
ncbi:MAG TPA: hypothetical protein VFO57_13425 [Burkholderiales bacterium]|nr:hypothetical protein [Burkholderiales bacterium]